MLAGSKRSIRHIYTGLEVLLQIFTKLKYVTRINLYEVFFFYRGKQKQTIKNDVSVSS